MIFYRIFFKFHHHYLDHNCRYDQLKFLKCMPDSGRGQTQSGRAGVYMSVNIAFRVYHTSDLIYSLSTEREMYSNRYKQYLRYHQLCRSMSGLGLMISTIESYL